jgi:ribosomal protein S18 acetylase RimI-like enzyme
VPFWQSGRDRGLRLPMVRRLGVVKVREARVPDAEEMGRVMVTSWLAGHRGQMPTRAWERRRDRWTPAVSAQAWQRALSERDALGERSPDWFLVAEDDRGTMVAVTLGSVTNTDPSALLGEVWALYVHPDHHRLGIGRQLLQQLAVCLADRGATSVQIGVLRVNHAARRFYEALGGRLAGERLIDENGDRLPECVYVWPDIHTLLPPS